MKNRALLAFGLLVVFGLSAGSASAAQDIVVRSNDTITGATGAESETYVFDGGKVVVRMYLDPSGQGRLKSISIKYLKVSKTFAIAREVYAYSNLPFGKMDKNLKNGDVSVRFSIAVATQPNKMQRDLLLVLDGTASGVELAFIE